MHSYSPRRDRELVQIVDSAFADAARRSGKWLLCRPGCTQCCIGVFAINALDAVRLEEGLKDLEKLAPERAARVRERARDAVSRLSQDFPGDPATGLLDESNESARRFAEFANDEPCPVLDPDTGRCDLYESRPMTCRVFGPPLRSQEGLGVCELSFTVRQTRKLRLAKSIQTRMIWNSLWFMKLKKLLVPTVRRLSRSV